MYAQCILVVMGGACAETRSCSECALLLIQHMHGTSIGGAGVRRNKQQETVSVILVYMHAYYAYVASFRNCFFFLREEEIARPSGVI